VLKVVDHPLVQDALAELRDTRTAPPAFRRAANRISVLLAAEALRDVPVSPRRRDDPAGSGGRTRGEDRRRGGARPACRARHARCGTRVTAHSAGSGHIGLQRDEATAIASRYYSKLPPSVADSFVLMIDPMLATGGSAAAAIDLIKAAGARTIRMICIVSAPEGVTLLEARHPDVVIYTPVIDRELNAHKFIVPGLGDFGDRLYGTS
jgi:uracil phosphoribosyltransferase